MAIEEKKQNASIIGTHSSKFHLVSYNIVLLKMEYSIVECKVAPSNVFVVTQTEKYHAVLSGMILLHLSTSFLTPKVFCMRLYLCE